MLTNLLAGTVLIGFGGAALAAEVAGTISQIDPAQGVLVLEDGNQFVLAPGIALDGIEPGTPVTVTFEDQGGQMVATEVKPQG